MSKKTIKNLDKMANTLEAFVQGLCHILWHGALNCVELLISDLCDGKRARRSRRITRITCISTRRTARAPRATCTSYRPAVYRQPAPVVVINLVGAAA